MKKYQNTIIAIGGGEIGRPGFPVETTKIDKEIIYRSAKTSPKLLFIPTASHDSESYIHTVKKHFSKKLGCQIDTLLMSEMRNYSTAKTKIFDADIVYVGGGNTLSMLKFWKKHKIDHLLKSAWKKGTIMSGLSAGSICWFKWGNSDSRKFKDKNAPLIKVRGLGFVNALHCPHYDTEKDREKELKLMMKKTAGVSIALDNCAAIEIVNDSYRILSSKVTANAYRVFWKKNKYFKEVITKSTTFKPLAFLLKK